MGLRLHRSVRTGRSASGLMIAIESAELKPSLGLTASIDSLGITAPKALNARSKGFRVWQIRSTPQTSPLLLYCLLTEIHTKRLLTGFVAATFFGHFSVINSDTKTRETG